jgi:hypothetical protein
MSPAELADLVRRLDARNVNLVKLAHLRIALEFSGVADRAEQDRLILGARQAGLVSLVAVEGGRRGGPGVKDLAAGIQDGATLLAYISTRW